MYFQDEEQSPPSRAAIICCSYTCLEHHVLLQGLLAFKMLSMASTHSAQNALYPTCRRMPYCRLQLGSSGYCSSLQATSAAVAGHAWVSQLRLLAPVTGTPCRASSIQAAAHGPGRTVPAHDQPQEQRLHSSCKPPRQSQLRAGCLQGDQSGAHHWDRQGHT